MCVCVVQNNADVAVQHPAGSAGLAVTAGSAGSAAAAGMAAGGSTMGRTGEGRPGARLTGCSLHARRHGWNGGRTTQDGGQVQDSASWPVWRIHGMQPWQPGSPATWQERGSPHRGEERGQGGRWLRRPHKGTHLQKPGLSSTRWRCMIGVVAGSPARSDGE